MKNNEFFVKIYTLQNNKFQVAYINPILNKRVRKKFYSLSEAQAYKNELIERFSREFNSSAIVSNWIKNYFEVKPNSALSRIGTPVFSEFINTFGNRPVSSITHEELHSWIKDIQIKNNYSDRTMPNVRYPLNQFFQFLVDIKAIETNPMTKVKILRGLPKKDRTILNEDDINELLCRIKEISPSIVYPVMFLIAHTGARLSEILKLQWKHIQYDLGAIYLAKTKNGDDRLIHVSNHVLEFLNVEATT